METGIHELTAGYALDALDSDERRAYEEHLEGCERCQAELASFWEVTAAMALATSGPEPSVELRQRIIDQARAERQNVIPLRRRLRPVQTRVLAVAAAAAAIVAIGLGAWAVTLKTRLDDRNGELSANRATLAIVSDPSARTVGLAKGDGRVVVAAGRAVMVLNKLAAAPSGKTYELWVITGSTARRAGLFTNSGTAVVRLERPVAKGDVVAVTLERSGGVDAPTSTPLAASRPV
jgi:anti-sigma-K factor RskA